MVRENLIILSPDSNNLIFWLCNFYCFRWTTFL